MGRGDQQHSKSRSWWCLGMTCPWQKCLPKITLRLGPTLPQSCVCVSEKQKVREKLGVSWWWGGGPACPVSSFLDLVNSDWVWKSILVHMHWWVLLYIHKFICTHNHVGVYFIRPYTLMYTSYMCIHIGVCFLYTYILVYISSSLGTSWGMFYWCPKG